MSATACTTPLSVVQVAAPKRRVARLMWWLQQLGDFINQITKPIVGKNQGHFAYVW
jgi:hypothetical protein